MAKKTETILLQKSHRAWLPATTRLSSLCFFLIFLFTAHSLFADDAREKIYARRTETAFLQAQARFQANTNDPVAGWQFARASFDWADVPANKPWRAEIARSGMAACHRSLELTNSAAAHYYLALNMGQLARVELMGGLKLVREMEQEFAATAGLDAHFDFAGAARGLGLLYRDAPGWPVSIGNRQKARQCLENAVALAPNYPENLLNLGESNLKWDDTAGAKKQLAALNALWPQAQKNLTGEAWEQSWDDWSKRRDDLRNSLN